MLDKLSRKIAICEFDENLTFDLKNILLPKRLSHIQFDCEDHALLEPFHRIEIELLVFKVIASFI